MPSIPFPNVPNLPGVPQLMRPVNAAVAQVPSLAVSLGSFSTILGQSLQQTPRWGIFDAQGNQLGLNSNTTPSILSVLESQVLGSSVPTLSTYGFDFVKEMAVSGFPTEGGGFANYNKVEQPANPVVTLILDGSAGYRTNFLNAIDAACKSTNVYNVVTPELTYVGYTMERYTYARRAQRGATLIIVDISMKEARAVTATFTTAIVAPQNPSSTPQVNNGMTQPTTPDTSTLKQFTNKLAGLF